MLGAWAKGSVGATSIFGNNYFSQFGQYKEKGRNAEAREKNQFIQQSWTIVGLVINF
jgi:hypothetical protein